MTKFFFVIQLRTFTKKIFFAAKLTFLNLKTVSTKFIFTCDWIAFYSAGLKLQRCNLISPRHHREVIEEIFKTLAVMYNEYKTGARAYSIVWVHQKSNNLREISKSTRPYHCFVWWIEVHKPPDTEWQPAHCKCWHDSKRGLPNDFRSL